MPCFICFLIFPYNKNDPKIKVLRMPCKFNMIFSEFLVQIILEGGAPGGHNPPGRARTPRRTLMGCGPHVGPLTYLLIPHHHLPPEKITFALSLVFLLPKPRNSISLLEAPFSELFRGIVAWYVTPSFFQLVFSLVVYILNN